MSVVLLDGVTFTAPVVHVVFIGIKGKATMVQTVVTPPIELDSSADLSIKDIIVRAALERFHLSAEDAVESLGLAAGGGTTVFRSTALTLAPQTQLTDLAACAVVTALDDTAVTPMKALFLIVNVKVEKLARERARSAYRLFEALKTEASVEGTALSDTAFAAVCGLTCSTFSKAMARVASVPTPADGGIVAKLEKRIAGYRADLASLKRDLDGLAAARKVHNCHAHSLSSVCRLPRACSQGSA